MPQFTQGPECTLFLTGLIASQHYTADFHFSKRLWVLKISLIVLWPVAIPEQKHSFSQEKGTMAELCYLVRDY